MTDETITGQVPPPEDPSQERPRFSRALDKYEEYLKTVQVTGSGEQRARHFEDLMRACNGIVDAAQTFDFISSIPSLAKTGASEAAGRDLARQLQSPDIPDEVRGIYRDLYGADLVQYDESENLPRA